MSASNAPDGPTRLDSWKEIAAFLGRDERTVNRWEKELGLPVHRLPGTKGRVYAYTEELSAWLATPKRASGTLPENGAAEDDSVTQTGPHTAPRPTQTSPRAARKNLGLTVIPGRGGAVEAAPLKTLTGEEIRADSTPSLDYRNALGLLVLAISIVGTIALCAVLYFPRVNRTSMNAGQAVGSAARGTLGGDAQRPTNPSHDPEAEQFYLKGRYYWNKRTPDDLNKALDYFTQSVVHDPNYAPAYVGMADCYNLLREYTLMPASDAYPRALAAAKKAVQLDDRSSEAHASLAFASFFGMWDVATGEREFRRAIELNPNNPVPHQWYANSLLAMHRLPEALDEIARAQTLDPSSISILADKGNILAAAGKRDEALVLLTQLEKRDPAFRSLHLYLEYVYLRERDYPNFLLESRKDALLVHDDAALAVTAAAEGGFARGGAQGMLEAMLGEQKKLYARNAIPPTALAQTLALLGNKQEALRYLETGYQQRDSALIFIKAEPEFDALHEEPAYRELLARMNLPLDKVQ
jgi:tetratricopeptide (TPR) repeat protein